MPDCIAKDWRERLGEWRCLVGVTLACQAGSFDALRVADTRSPGPRLAAPKIRAESSSEDRSEANSMFMEVSDGSEDTRGWPLSPDGRGCPRWSQNSL